ncbi:MAG: glycosyltransferase family 4 protein [Myxococcota bacterium]
MRVLVITKIFPHAADLAGAPYNRHQFAAMAKHCDVDVLGLIPWFPGAQRLRRTKSASTAAIPYRERIEGLPVAHPRVLYVPKVGHAVAGVTYAASILPYVAARRGRYDVVLGSFAYPDGWAAVVIARLLGVPAVIKLHGGDINELRKSRLVLPHLRWALSRAAGVVATSRALADAAIEVGARADRTTVIFNGVDMDLFRLRSRQACREQLGQPTDGRWLVFVGRIETRKGVRELMEAFAKTAREHPDVRLMMVGGGTEEAECKAFAEREGLPVVFPGPCSHEDVATWIGASDLLVLPSHAEGTPNVVIEALVSGRRVVATAVGGIPAVIKDPALGRLVPCGDASALAEALGEEVERPYEPEAVKAAAGFGSWDESGRALYDVVERAVRG